MVDIYLHIFMTNTEYQYQQHGGGEVRERPEENSARLIPPTYNKCMLASQTGKPRNNESEWGILQQIK